MVISQDGQENVRSFESSTVSEGWQTRLFRRAGLPGVLPLHVSARTPHGYLV